MARPSPRVSPLPRSRGPCAPTPPIMPTRSAARLGELHQRALLELLLRRRRPAERRPEREGFADPGELDGVADRAVESGVRHALEDRGPVGCKSVVIGPQEAGVVVNFEGVAKRVHLLVTPHALAVAFDALGEPVAGALARVAPNELGLDHDELQWRHGLAEEVLANQLAAVDHVGVVLEVATVSGEEGWVGEHAGPLGRGQGDPALGASGADVSGESVRAVHVVCALVDGAAGVGGARGDVEEA